MNKSFEDQIETKKGQPLGFLVVEPENLKFPHAPPKKKTKKEEKGCISKTKTQMGGFLNRYNFAYAGRDTVNQAAKVAPGVSKSAANGVNNIAKQRIDQMILQDGKEIERVLPKVFREAIGDVYQAPFGLLGNFGKQQLNKLNREILN